MNKDLERLRRIAIRCARSSLTDLNVDLNHVHYARMFYDLQFVIYQELKKVLSHTNSDIDMETPSNSPTVIDDWVKIVYVGEPYTTVDGVSLITGAKTELPKSIWEKVNIYMNGWEIETDNTTS